MSRGASAKHSARAITIAQEHKGEHVSKDLNPTWNQRFSFSGTLRDLVGQILEVPQQDATTTRPPHEINVSRSRPATCHVATPPRVRFT